MLATKTRSAELFQQLVDALVDEGMESGEFTVDFMQYAQMESLGHGLGQELSRQVQETLAERQREQMPDELPCPQCQKICRAEESRDFGPLMAAEGHRRGFYGAARQAFVGDGMKCHWTIQKTHFPSFTPIVDLLHVISYLYHAALAVGGDEDFGWGYCLERTRACWQGRVGDVTEELTAWLATQEPLPEGGVRDDDPRVIVGKALTYLRNNGSRMKYPEYRRQGLPLTSSLMESLIEEISWPVKGPEKFWNDPSGANPILALRAASLCDDNRLEILLTE